MAIKKPKVSTLYRLTQNVSTWGRNRPAFLVIHFTGSLADTQAAQLSTYKSYLAAGSNAHYLVGAAGIWEMVDPETYYTKCSVGSACGKKTVCKVKGWGITAHKGPLAGDHAGVVGHQNSISVEICSGKAGRKACDPTDDGWYFTESTYVKAVELAAWICDHWGIKTSDIVMHNQVTGKLCPAMWCNRDGAEAGFYQFRADVAYKLNELDRPIVSPSPEPDNTRTVPVSAGMYFYSRPTQASARIGQAQKDGDLNYTIEQNGFCCTEQGWVSK